MVIIEVSYHKIRILWAIGRLKTSNNALIKRLQVRGCIWQKVNKGYISKGRQRRALIVLWLRVGMWITRAVITK